MDRIAVWALTVLASLLCLMGFARLGCVGKPSLEA